MGIGSVIAKAVNLGVKTFKYSGRAAKVAPYVVFTEKGSDVFVKAVRDVPLKDFFKAGGKALEEFAEKEVKKSGGKGILGSMWNSFKKIPADFKTKLDKAKTVAKRYNKGDFWAVRKALSKTVLSKMPLLNNLLMVGFELPNIFEAFADEGVFGGIKEIFKSSTKLCVGSIGGSAGKKFGLVGSLVGWTVGDKVASCVVGKRHTEIKAEKQEQLQQLLQQSPLLAEQQTQFPQFSQSQQQFGQQQVDQQYQTGYQQFNQPQTQQQVAQQQFQYQSQYPMNFGPNPFLSTQLGGGSIYRNDIFGSQLDFQV